MELNIIYQAEKLYKLNPSMDRKRDEMVIKTDGFGGVAILYEYEQDSLLTSDLAVFLGKVIEGGMKLNTAHVLIANMSYTDVTLQKLAEKAKTKTVVIFGTKWLIELHNINMQKNEIVKLYGMKVLATDTLDIINTNDGAKKAFWTELKKLF